VAKKIFRKPIRKADHVFAKQIAVFAEPIRLIIGFAKNVFSNNIQKTQKTYFEFQKKIYSLIGFAKAQVNIKNLKKSNILYMKYVSVLTNLISLKHHLIISNLAGYNKKLLKFLLFFNDYSCIGISLNWILAGFSCKITYLNIISGNIRRQKGLKVLLPALLILAVSAFPIQLSAQQLKTNLELFEQEISAELDKVYYLPEVNRELKFVFWVSSAKKSKEDKKFIEQLVRKSADKNKLKYSFAKNDSINAPDTAYIKFSITVDKLNTVYTKLIKNGFLGEKSMQREITSAMSLKVSDNSEKVLFDEDIKTKFDDEIPYDDYTRFESGEYRFTQSTPPDISFLESIIFPAAVVTVSAIAAVLFFTIRSK